MTMPLKYKGKPIEKASFDDIRRGTPAQDAFEKYLRSLPNDEVFDSSDMMGKGFSYNLVKEKAPRVKRFTTFTCVINRQRFWGSPAAIKQLQKENNAEN